MSRKCSKCGNNVIVGQGKWDVSKGLEAATLRHKDDSLCQASDTKRKVGGEALKQARMAKSKAPTEDSDGPNA